jgi:MTH538 TIR-like domain (DUF1863)
MSKKIFISFDYDNDKHYKFLLTALNAHPGFDLIFEDLSSREINSSNIAVVRAGLTAKINQADYTLVIIGRYANTLHRDAALIGYRNWINFEIAKSKAAGNRLIAIKLDSSYVSPEEILGAGAKWAMSYTVPAIAKAIDEA